MAAGGQVAVGAAGAFRAGPRMDRHGCGSEYTSSNNLVLPSSGFGFWPSRTHGTVCDGDVQ
jgi:hypothetical protein